MKALPLAIILGMICLLSFNCAPPSTEPPAVTPAPTLTPLPSLPVHEIKLMENATFLAPASLEALASVSADQSELLLSAGVPEVAALTAGEVIIIGVTAQTPHGLLRKIINITHENNQVKLETVPAALEEAIRSGTLYYSGPLPGTAAAAPLLQGRGLSHTEEGLYISIDGINLYETDYFRLAAKGGIWIDPWIDFYCDFKDAAVDYLRFSVNLKVTCKLTLEAVFVAGAEVTRYPLDNIRKDLLPGWEAGEFVVPTPIVVPTPLGPIPLFITFKPVIGIEGELYAGLKSEVTQIMTGRIGFIYNQGQYTPFADLNSTFNLTPLALTAGANLKAYAGIEIGLKPFKIISGPYVFPHLYLALESDLFDTPWWKLYGGYEICGGFRPGILSLSLYDWHFPLSLGRRTLLAEAQSAPPLINGTLKGLVTAARTGRALRDVEIEVYKQAYYPGAPLYTQGTTDPAGKYQLAIQAGTGYTLRFSREGYQDELMRGVDIENFTVNTLDVALKPLGNLITSFTMEEPESFLGSMYHATLCIDNPAGEAYFYQGEFLVNYLTTDRNGAVIEVPVEAYLDPYNLGIGVDSFTSSESEIRLLPGLDSFVPISKAVFRISVFKAGTLVDSVCWEKDYPVFYLLQNNVEDQSDGDGNITRTVSWELYNPAGLEYTVTYRSEAEGISSTIYTAASTYSFAYNTQVETSDITIVFSYQGREIFSARFNEVPEM